MTAPEITELDSQTVERIAAGEVVERPASAVKELVENSIDADADRVTVAVESGGRELIRVSDDGVGMSESTVRKAIEEHTTSKISDISDLEAGVGTLGFRGEALHAIGAVSRMTITTRPRGGDRGTELTVEGGEVTDVSPAGCPEGTTVEIRDLFYNVPARRKYLKQDATEFAHVNTVVTNYALANPDVAVTLEHNQRETFATTGTDDLRETVLSVYGREVAESMIELSDDELEDGPLDGVSGLISHPETNRASREYLSTFVNGRYVTANAVRDAVIDAYGGQLAADRYPFAVVFLEIDPSTIDVNVHPRKMEIRFADEQGMRTQIESAVEEALLGDGLIRSKAPRGRSAAGETEIDPQTTADSQDESVETEGGGDSIDRISSEDIAAANTDTAGKQPNQTDSGTGTPPMDTDTGTEQSTSTASTVSSDETNPRSGGRLEESGSGTTTEHSTVEASESADFSTEPETTSTPSNPTDSSGESSDTVRDQTRKFTGEQTQETLGEGRDDDTTFESLPSLRVLGQHQETYIVAETEEGLVMIDQHAADERINYERLREKLLADTTTQALASPVEVELTAREAELFASHRDALASLGFHASLVGDRTVEVTTVPSLVADVADPTFLRELLDDFVSGAETAAETVEAAADELLADMACYPSIKGNTSLTDGTVVDLLETLDDCENPYACPHGRPVIIEFDTDEIEARFERDYPGH